MASLLADLLFLSDLITLTTFSQGAGNKNKEGQQLGKREQQLTAIGLPKPLIFRILKNVLTELATMFGFDVSFLSCII